MTSDVWFGSEPTAAGDTEARLMRDWYENHRETWLDRLWLRRHPGTADNFMLGLMQQAIRIRDAREAEDADRARNQHEDHHG